MQSHVFAMYTVVHKDEIVYDKASSIILTHPCVKCAVCTPGLEFCCNVKLCRSMYIFRGRQHFSLFNTLAQNHSIIVSRYKRGLLMNENGFLGQFVVLGFRSELMINHLFGQVSY